MGQSKIKGFILFAASFVIMIAIAIIILSAVGIGIGELL
jgi:hypothetical protein